MATIKASSLVEVLVALVITVSVFTTGTVIYMQTLSNGVSGIQIRAIELAGQVFEESYSMQKKNRIIESNNQKAEVYFSDWENSSRILVINIAVKDADDKVIYSEKHLIPK